MTTGKVVIAGGGIGGLALALTLHQIGVDCVVLESVHDLKPLGVGINLQPNAVRELHDLGIGEDELDEVGIAAREWVEQHTGQILTSTCNVTENLETFPAGSIALRWLPVASVTSVTYTSTAGSTTTWDSANYTVHLASGRIAPAQGKDYPTDVGDVIAPISIAYAAYFATVPIAIKQAILLIVGDMYETRVDTVKRLPTAVEYLLAPWRNLSHL